MRPAVVFVAGVLLLGAPRAGLAEEPFGRPMPEQFGWWVEEAATAAQQDAESALNQVADPGRERRALGRLCWWEELLSAPPGSCERGLAAARGDGDAESEGWILALRGNALIWAGHYAAGSAALDAALSVAPAGSAARAVAEVTRGGQVLEGGDFDGALDWLDRARADAQLAGDREWEGWAEIWRSRVYALLGAEEAAVDAGGRGRELARAGEDSNAAAFAELMLGLAHLEVRNAEAALEPARRGLELAERARAPVGKFLIEAVLTEALIALDRLDEAAMHLESLERAVASGEAPPPFAASAIELRARWLAAGGEPESAVAQYRRALAQAKTVSLTERARLGLARALAAAGDRAGAIAAYREAIAGIEGARSGATVEELRAHFFTVRVDTYRELAALLMRSQGPGAAVEALRVAEAGRARALADARRASSLGNSVADGALERSPLEPDGLARQLGSARALVEYVVASDSTFALLVHGGEAAKVEAIALPAAGGAFRLAERVDFFRRRVREAASAEDLFAAGRRLHEDLLSPVLARLPADLSGLVVIPDGALHALPFDALVAGGTAERPEFLFSRTELTLGPSAALALSDSPPLGGVADESLVVAFSGGEGSAAVVRGGAKPLRQLRFTEQEARRVAAAAGRALRLEEGEANEARLRGLAMNRFGLLHFAAHGIVHSGMPQRSALRLAASGADDGWLTVGEIFDLKLPGSLVVLSACATGSGPIAGGEGALSLARAFLAAGAATVAATYWELDDRGAVELVERFHLELAAGKSAEQALAEARRRALARGEPPAVWANFALWGAPGFHSSPNRAAPPASWPLPAGFALLLATLGTVLLLRRGSRGA